MLTSMADTLIYGAEAARRGVVRIDDDGWDSGAASRAAVRVFNPGPGVLG